MRPSASFCLVFFITLALYLNPNPASADRSLRSFASRLSTHSALSVIDLRSGRYVLAKHELEPLKPASVMKLVTTAAALELLGPEFVFETEILVEGRQGGAVDTLTVRGGGDPTLTIEQGWLLARRIKALGVSEIRTLQIDAESFGSPRLRVGLRAYETGSSALSFSWNSIGFEVCPTEVGEAALIRVEPSELDPPLTSTVKTVKNGVASLEVDDQTDCSERGCDYRFKVSGVVPDGAECLMLYRAIARPEEFFAQTFIGLLRKNGVRVGSNFSYGVARPQATNLFTHASKPIREIIRDLNHFSNNFVAEQLVYALGRADSGEFSHERGVERLSNYLKSLGCKQEEFWIVDGSGLSHENRLSSRVVTQVLRAAMLSPRSGVEFLASLPVMGRNGTLKKRGSGDEPFVLRGKTGSLDGVSSLAGAVLVEEGRTALFALIQNRVASKSEAVKIEDEALREIAASLD